MDLLSLRQHREEDKRLAEIVRILARYGLDGWLRKLPHQPVRDLLTSREIQVIPEMPVAVRLRLALTEMGPTYFKLGQVLSTRADLVGPEIAAELQKLQADTPADSPEIARRVIEEELGKAPEELFAEFKLPSAATRLLKTLVRLEGTARLLSPSFSLSQVIVPFREKLILSRLDPKHWTRWLQQSMRDLDRLVRNGPRNIANILDHAQSGKLQIRHKVDHLELVANRLVGGMLTASLFMGSALLLSHNVPPLAFGESVLGGIGLVAAVAFGGRILWRIRSDIG